MMPCPYGFSLRTGIHKYRAALKLHTICSKRHFPSLPSNYPLILIALHTEQASYYSLLKSRTTAKEVSYEY